MPKTAIITGITGQDGAYLAELLISKGYVVHGIKRRTSLFNTERIDKLYNDYFLHKGRFFLHFGDMTDSTNIIRLINEIKPDEIYNLAAMSHVKVSFEIPEYVVDADGVGTLRILESIRILGLQNKIRVYQASTSELFGKVQEIPQNETTPFYPRSPYGVAKLYAYWITVNYRESYNIFASNGILFNHESPLRGETFVTRKISIAVANIFLGRKKKFFLGNLDAKRDWGHAKDFVKAMWLILQVEKPDDWVISTGRLTSVRELLHMAFGYIGVELEFKGQGVNEIGIVKSCNNKKCKVHIGQEVIGINPDYFRPAEVDLLLGDSRKANKQLGWKPETNIEEIIAEMVQSDIDSIIKS